jgi:hypothetical protein
MEAFMGSYVVEVLGVALGFGLVLFAVWYLKIDRGDILEFTLRQLRNMLKFGRRPPLHPTSVPSSGPINIELRTPAKCLLELPLFLKKLVSEQGKSYITKDSIFLNCDSTDVHEGSLVTVYVGAVYCRQVKVRADARAYYLILPFADEILREINESI